MHVSTVVQATMVDEDLKSTTSLIKGRTRLSSVSTLALKLVAIALVILAGYMLGITATREGAVAVGGMMASLLGVCCVCWFVCRLATVWTHQEGLEVRRLWRARRVPYTSITSVDSHHFLSAFVVTLPQVTVTIQSPDGSRTKFRFLAKFTLTGWSPGVHPTVDVLRCLRRSKEETGRWNMNDEG